MDVHGNLGIGHTRWATHGAANETNAHPHVSKHFAVVHNGIIENYREIRESLEMSGFSFESETDTEVIPKLLELNYTGSVEEAIKKTLPLLKGSYALGIVCSESPDTLYCAKNGSPLIIGVGDDENYISSDINPLLGKTNRAIYLDDGETASITTEEITVYGRNFEPVQKEIKSVQLPKSSADKGEFEHFMLKEIYEQPQAVADTINSVSNGESIVFKDFPFTDEEIKILTGCIL